VLNRSGNGVVWKGVAGILLMAIALTFFSACAAPTTLALGADDNGNEITLHRGQMLTITLEGNPSTGYTWELMQTEGAILKQVGETEFQADSQVPGAAGTQSLRFEAVATGQMELRLVYHRPWETDVEPLETFTVQVTVR
jgi:inhibitor of cysteine peptidase